LASLDYNLGWTTRGGEKNEAMRAAIKAGDMGAARELFGTYTHVGGPHGRVLKGLVTRRQEELSIFDRPDQPRPGGASSIDLAAAKRRAGIMDGEGRKLDGDSQSVTVNGKGQLDVKVSAPAGTRVKANGDGLLKDTRVQQETQMTPASKQGKLTEIEAD
jgi:hypothetical protein